MIAVINYKYDWSNKIVIPTILPNNISMFDIQYEWCVTDCNGLCCDTWNRIMVCSYWSQSVRKIIKGLAGKDISDKLQFEWFKYIAIEIGMSHQNSIPIAICLTIWTESRSRILNRKFISFVGQPIWGRLAKILTGSLCQ